MARQAVARAGGNDAHGRTGAAERGGYFVDRAVAAAGKHGPDSAFGSLTGQFIAMTRRFGESHVKVHAHMPHLAADVGYDTRF